jgi:hypothetical protein
VTKTSVPGHERAGVGHRYHVADPKEGATVAILVVRSCREPALSDQPTLARRSGLTVTGGRLQLRPAVIMVGIK